MIFIDCIICTIDNYYILQHPDKTERYTFDSPIVDVSLLSKNQVAVVLENGNIFIQDGLLSFALVAHPDSFSQYKVIKGQRVCWGTPDCFIVCLRCDNELRVLNVCKKVLFHATNDG